MALASAIQGARHTAQQITWAPVDGSKQVLTGATITARIKDAAGNSTAATGVFTVTDAANGVFTWAYSAADVATAGSYTVQFTATFADTTVDRTFAESWPVEVAL